jgi:hypothetical protein
VQLKTALLRGIKKRPGTALPPELAMRMIYINVGQGQLEYKVGFSALRDIILNSMYRSITGW